MRRVLFGDVTAAARALLAAPPEDRAGLLARLISEADTAEAHRRATGRAHPQFGTGSLMSAALGHSVAVEPPLASPAYAACMAEVFTALAALAGAGQAEEVHRCGGRD